ncbi:MAG: alternative ribosome rescue aminoacyl-tRNA hydrolase ArfB [Paracoccaceae bacterium]
MLRITDDISIQDWELSEQFVRSSGPGGQNVNKVSSAVELRFEASRSPSLPPFVKARLEKIAGQKWTKEGAIVIFCDETRHQARNREIARDRLVDMIQRAAIRPKRRIVTKPTKGSQIRRVTAKKIRGEIKKNRGSVTEGLD